MDDKTKYFKKNFELIEWNAYNSGQEAEDAKMLKHDFGKEYNNKTICETLSAFLGHHFVECKIIRKHEGTIKVTFPIFVQ